MHKNEKKVDFVHAERSGTSSLQKKCSHVIASYISLEATQNTVVWHFLEATSAVLCGLVSKDEKNVNFVHA